MHDLTQVLTCMTTESSAAPTISPAVSARDRLLAAAKLVFARDGLQGATTRAIAQEAGVNEVTLFRHFQNKERLIGEVMESIVMQKHLAEPVGAQKAWTGSLKTNLRRYAETLYSVMERDEPLIRTMLGEAFR
ncbi:MAG: TetR/AcrR family transcriptional regulator [Cytophagaceae bacterium]|nr:MAG: TetR/AcrR family transcriptional regulator [Cytophagaceae bacterium]